MNISSPNFRLDQCTGGELTAGVVRFRQAIRTAKYGANPADVVVVGPGVEVYSETGSYDLDSTDLLICHAAVIGTKGAIAGDVMIRIEMSFGSAVLQVFGTPGLWDFRSYAVGVGALQSYIYTKVFRCTAAGDAHMHILANSGGSEWTVAAGAGGMYSYALVKPWP